MVNVIAFAMIGLVFGLSHWILYCGGARACPAWWSKKTKPEDVIPEQAIGAMGQLAAGAGLLLMALWFIFTPGLDAYAILVVAGAIFGFLFLGMAIVAMKGWDWRPIGDAAIFGGFTMFVMLPFAANNGFPWDACLGLAIFGILATAWGLVIHGKISAKILRADLFLSLFVAWWFVIFYGGLHAPLQVVVDAQNAFGTMPDGTFPSWGALWIIVGIVNFVLMYWSYRRGPSKQLFW
ncbi:MAG TPA: hypothetical protein VMB46_02790 [Methanomassiliicoccales archaeon]|nr:hypothetical protein [Methanomassiliicoccales archaeon]